MITLKDVAAAAGVSSSAVSLVLSGRHRGRVNSDTAARIRRVADDMGYIPNQLARGLKTRRTHTIGVVADRVATVPFAGRMLEGLQSAAAASGYVAMIIDTASDPDLVPHATRSLLQRDIDGLVIACEYPRIVDVPVAPSELPIVTLDGYASSPEVADAVVPDEHGGAFAATTHLLDRGHRRIALFTLDPDAFIAVRLRREGYVGALEARGVPFEPRLVVTSPDTATVAAYPAALALLSGPERPTAVFCFSDQMAFAIYQAAEGLGLKIPEDLSVVGFDDQRYIADALRPGLTTVRLPHADMGAWASQRILDRISGVATGPTVVHREPCRLIERDSVAAPPH